MTTVASALSLAKRARRLSARDDGVLFLQIIGNPEHVRRGLPMASDREALIGKDHYQALDGESTEAFHKRLREVARELHRAQPRGADGEQRLVMVELGHPDNTEPLKEAPPYPPLPPIV